MQHHDGLEGGQTITLPPVLDREAVAAMLPDLRRAVQAGPVRLDGVQVERIGQAGLQLVLSILRSGPFRASVVTCSAALHKAATLAGLDEMLALPDAEQAA